MKSFLTVVPPKHFQSRHRLATYKSDTKDFGLDGGVKMSAPLINSAGSKLLIFLAELIQSLQITSAAEPSDGCEMCGSCRSTMSCNCHSFICQGRRTCTTGLVVSFHGALHVSTLPHNLIQLLPDQVLHVCTQVADLLQPWL